MKLITKIIIIFNFIFSSQKEIEQITFTGNSHISSKELSEAISLKQSSIFNKSFYNSSLLKLSNIQLKNLYNSKGFINVKIKPIVDINNNKVIVKYDIDEENQYFIKEINFVGNRIFSSQQLLNMLEVEVDDVFNPLKITKKLKKIIQNYLEAGKFYISIMDEFFEENNKVSIRINISEGKTYYFGNTSVVGLKKLKPNIISRESIIKNGEIYNISRIEETQTRIFSSLLFSSVEILPQFRDEINDTIDLVIKVKEMSNRDIKGEVGFGQTESVKGPNHPPNTNIELSSTIQSGFFLNTPNKFTFKVDLGILNNGDNILNFLNVKNTLFPRRNFSLGYRTPWIYKLRIPLNLKIYDHYVEEGEKTRHKQGIDALFSYRKSERNRLEGRFVLEFVDYLDTPRELERKFKITHQRHSLDNLISPKTGGFLGINVTLRGTFLGGNTHYVLSDIEYRNFHHIFNKAVFCYRFKYGIINILKNTNEETISEFFYLGGNTSLRGWSKEDSLYNNDDNDKNENALLRNLTNIELRIPLYNNIGCGIFFDAGILGRENKDINFSKYYWNIGYGISYNTPLGPVRFDIAYPYAIGKYKSSFSLLYSF